MDIVEQITEKINEYNLGLFKDYKTKDKGISFIIRDMMIFFDEEDGIMSVHFKVMKKNKDETIKL